MKTESQEFTNNMDIPVKAEMKNRNTYFPFENPKVESDIRIKIEADSVAMPKLEAGIKIKIEPIEEFDRSMEIITNMIIPTNAEIKNENIDAPYEKRKKMEMDFKPKIETDFKVKSEPNDDIIRGMKIIDNMNIPTQLRDRVEKPGALLLPTMLPNPFPTYQSKNWLFPFLQSFYSQTKVPNHLDVKISLYQRIW